MLIDTHTHIYLEEFDDDRDEVIVRSLSSGIEKLFLPNIDSGSIENMLALAEKYPKICYPMIGLHPGSVSENFLDELELLKTYFDKNKFIGVGEIGIDLYWDKTYKNEQEKAFEIQLNWAKEYSLPVVIHARESFNEIYKVLDKVYENGMKGVFHSFTGSSKDVEKIKEYDFYYGINGILSFKNSHLPNILKSIPKNRLLLETDSPYLAPMPKRGKRNESSFLKYTCEKLAETLSIEVKEVEEFTTRNALDLFFGTDGF